MLTLIAKSTYQKLRCKNIIAEPKELIRNNKGSELLVWYEFQISTNPEKQRQIIRQLRNWIENLESRGIVQGFAFDHYSPNPEALHIRFDCADENNLKTVRKELENEVKKYLPNYVLPPDRLWDGGTNTEQVYKAYEFGSRCAFLAWKLIESGRFPEEYFSDFWLKENGKAVGAKKSPFEFQFHFTHGLMNSLGISKYPNEAFLHSRLLSSILTQCNIIRSKEELANWIAEMHALEIIP